MQDEVLVTCSICGRLRVPVDALAFEPACVGCASEHPFDRLRMRGSFPLQHAAIDDIVTRCSPGNFALGYADGPTFLVFYVGRSDTDVRARLHSWVGLASPCAGTSRARGGPGLVRPNWSPSGAALSARLADAATAYTRFAYSYAESAADAFAEQLRNYDDFGGSRELDNGEPPVRGESSELHPPTRQPAQRIRIARSVPRPRTDPPAR
jgi:hypothetical protein